ncbi:MAG TPA: N-acetylglucosamine-6-phosphate deacetylase [Terriglobia bacterium]|nr:N-acetylglucosamine-6-phosphate deacetylase [Terriglobia bacterium]
MNDHLTVVDAAVLLTPVEQFAPARLVIRNGRIDQAGKAGDIAPPAGATRLDLSRRTVAPGFIDLHIHGAGGVDVMEGSYAALNTVSRTIAAAGVTAFFPTTASSPAADLGAAVENLGSLIRGGGFEGATPLGIHLEGPFINPLKRGAHPAASLRSLDPENIRLLGEWSQRSGRAIRRVTFAPELPHAEDLIAMAKTEGFTLAMGHSDASADEASRAAAAGVRYAVHTFNAMRPFSPRDPGITGAVLTDDRIYAEIIADGIHVAPRGVRVFARSKGRDRVVLVTDAVAASGMPDGRYRLGSETIQLSGGVCRAADGHLAGSALRLDTALRNYMNWTDATLQDALFGVTVNPARALGLDGHGVIAPGARADLVAIDSHGEVSLTMVGGRVVYERA